MQNIHFNNFDALPIRQGMGRRNGDGRRDCRACGVRPGQPALGGLCMRCHRGAADRTRAEALRPATTDTAFQMKEAA